MASKVLVIPYDGVPIEVGIEHPVVDSPHVQIRIVGEEKDAATVLLPHEARLLVEVLRHMADLAESLS